MKQSYNLGTLHAPALSDFVPHVEYIYNANPCSQHQVCNRVLVPNH